jgi:hypothetical protein
MPCRGTSEAFNTEGTEFTEKTFQIGLTNLYRCE